MISINVFSCSSSMKFNDFPNGNRIFAIGMIAIGFLFYNKQYIHTMYNKVQCIVLHILNIDI
jgi:hypothetical protein